MKSNHHPQTATTVQLLVLVCLASVQRRGPDEATATEGSSRGHLQ